MVYTLGFFHNLEGENLGECRQLMADIASEGYHYEVSSADSIQFVFDDIAQQVSGGEYVYIKIACPVDVTVQKDGEVLRSEKKIRIFEQALEHCPLMEKKMRLRF